MKNVQRWYEKNESLKAFMNLFKDLPLTKQCEFAVDMIIKSSELCERKYEKIIEDVSSFNPKDYKRWYDKNPNVHLAVELFRDLTDEEKEEVINEFSEKIIKHLNINENIAENDEEYINNGC